MPPIAALLLLLAHLALVLAFPAESVPKQDICASGQRSIVENAFSRTQILTWAIGSVSSPGATCSAVINPAYNAEWQHAVTSVTWRGAAFLPARGPHARVGVVFGFQGWAPKTSLVAALSPPYTAPWSTSVSVPAENRLWSPCGLAAPPPLAFTWSVNITNFNPPHVIAGKMGDKDQPGGELTLSMGILWKKCVPGMLGNVTPEPGTVVGTAPVGGPGAGKPPPVLGTAPGAAGVPVLAPVADLVPTLPAAAGGGIGPAAVDGPATFEVHGRGRRDAEGRDG
ncbi:hypothetical protein EJ06DRAFT_2239 [Trichodelitschia bisporula]|uniref:Uncharacterized protein n=1 Tax=Trichodelitschia bisporula TaxID=703511 RepID=A0A6G1IA23_9PEZI|nr:hypothetical protein EJ06DRAFT_2239 [Trichodelitschia bisporula]